MNPTPADSTPPSDQTPADPTPADPSPPHSDSQNPPSTGGAAPAPFLVFGLNLVVRMKKQEEVSVPVQCPRGQPIQYGTVVAVGDGFDPQASQFRAMPPVGALVAFEETTEGTEGHYLFVDDDEFRVLHLDVITIGFPPA